MAEVDRSLRPARPAKTEDEFVKEAQELLYAQGGAIEKLKEILDGVLKQNKLISNALAEIDESLRTIENRIEALAARTSQLEAREVILKSRRSR